MARFQCDLCEKDYSLSSSLYNHNQAIHIGCKFKCPDCDYECSTKWSLNRHFKMVHTNIKEFKCSDCNYASSRKDKLTDHQKNCTGKFVGSAGEFRIVKILNELKVDYQYDKSYRGVRDKGLLRFDFVLNPDSDNPAIIEFDGEQHFQVVRWGRQSQAQAQKAYDNTIRRDKIKNDFCDDNDICMIRIPFHEKDNIENMVKDFVERTNF